MNKDLFGTVIIELDYDNLRMVLDGLRRIKEQHTEEGPYHQEAARLYDRLATKLNEREGEIRHGND